jgi:hypothetical protein
MNEDLLRVMESLSLEKYIGRFMEQELQLADLFILTDADIMELLPAMAPRARLVRWLASAGVSAPQTLGDGPCVSSSSTCVDNSVAGNIAAGSSTVRPVQHNASESSLNGMLSEKLKNQKKQLVIAVTLHRLRIGMLKQKRLFEECLEAETGTLLIQKTEMQLRLKKAEIQDGDLHRMRVFQHSVTGVDLSSWCTSFVPVGWRGVGYEGHCITSIKLSEMQAAGSPDLANLPSSLKTLCLHQNNFSGALNLTQLPRTLQSFWLHLHQFSGSVDLTQLPLLLDAFSLEADQLTGEVDLSHLPTTLSRLYIHNNKFTSVRISSNALRSAFPPTMHIDKNRWTRPLPTEPDWIASMM